MTKYLSVLEAQEKIVNQLSSTGIEEVPLLEASNRILASEIRAPFDLPLFSNSSMDGFALNSDDTINASPVNPTILSVVADIPAGTNSPDPLKPGEAARIMTGGMIPSGADAVVPVENTNYKQTSTLSELMKQVIINVPAKKGDYIRLRGQSIKTGNIVLQNGKTLNPQDIGTIAAFGYANVKVFKKPKIALLPTGDELIPPGKNLTNGKIYDSNSYMLTTLIEQYGGNCIKLDITPDNPGEIQKNLNLAQELGADLILTSAGVSVGTYDYVKAVIEKNGEVNFWRVNMRPGKPIAFGNYNKTPLIGLPGNPVSAFVCFMVFVVPALQKMAGNPLNSRRIIKVKLEQPIETDGRETYFRGFIHTKEGVMFGKLINHQGSDNLIGLSQANALLIIPSEVKSLAINSEVDAWPL